MSDVHNIEKLGPDGQPPAPGFGAAVSRALEQVNTAQVHAEELQGAYQRGEVKEIADLAHPKIGIITSIGPEHFERFLSMENIEETNYELIAAIPAES